MDLDEEADAEPADRAAGPGVLVVLNRGAVAIKTESSGGW